MKKTLRYKSILDVPVEIIRQKSPAIVFSEYSGNWYICGTPYGWFRNRYNAIRPFYSLRTAQRYKRKLLLEGL